MTAQNGQHINLARTGTAIQSAAHPTQMVLATGGTANSTLVIPDLGFILGLELHQQAFVLDPPANTLGATVSNALRLRIGL